MAHGIAMNAALARLDKQIKRIADRGIRQTINSSIILSRITGYRSAEISNAVVSTKWDDDVCKCHTREVINNFYGLATTYLLHLSTLLHGLTFEPVRVKKISSMYGSLDRIARTHLKYVTAYERGQWIMLYYQITDRFPDTKLEPWFIQFIYISHIMNLVWRLETCVKIVSKTNRHDLSDDLTLARSLLQPLLDSLPQDNLPQLPSHE